MKKTLAYLSVVLNAFLSALIFQLFVYPNDFAPAGVSGIATMIQYLFHINTGYLNLLINLPLAAVTFFFISKSHALRGMLYTLALSISLVIFGYIDFSPFIYHTQTGTSTILAPLTAGLVMGALNSQLVRIGGNQGGTFYLSLMIHKRRPEMNTFILTLSINAIVAAFSYFVYGMKIEPVLLCLMYNASAMITSDIIHKNSRTATRFEIVTENPADVRQVILNQFHRTATLLPGKGLYQGKQTNVLICVVNNLQAPYLAEVLRSIPKTFATMSRVNEVIGNFPHLDSQGRPEKQMIDLGDTNVV